ncbi:MAG TPA: indolepyruvate ferredoxin oxidoreductase subunit beta [Acidimicrobiales bacterium]|nr:indolepyruvate ferredoxin oxidoreductase subunit beta [Acidimicrobiales bacterium]
MIVEGAPDPPPGDPSGPSPTCPVVIAGVGGQGVISLARIVGRAAVAAGLSARVGQIYGLSQRGGSVEATVRFGPGRTAFVGPGEAEVVVALEPLEAERTVPSMSPRATVLVNDTAVVPTGSSRDGGSYPGTESILERIRAVAARVHLVNGTDLATGTGDIRLLNTVMLGVAAGMGILPVPTSNLAGELERSTPARRSSATLTAFRVGLETGEGICR